MTPIDKTADYHVNAPEGTRVVTFAKDQPQYLPLPALCTPDGRVVSTWQPSPGDLALLLAGAPITLTVWHGPLIETCPRCGGDNHHFLHPVRLEVGATNLREVD